MAIASNPAAQLTPAQHFPTKVPFPYFEEDKNVKPAPASDEGSSGQGVAVKPHPTQRVTFNTCSEFMTYRMPGSIFGTEGNHLKLLNDGKGQPMIFSIGTDHRLYVLYDDDVTAEATWQVADITPPGKTKNETKPVTAFDVIIVRDYLVISVAQKLNPPFSSVLTTTLKLPNSESIKSPQPTPFENLIWTHHRNALGANDSDRTEQIQKQITALINCPKEYQFGVPKSEVGNIGNLSSVIVSTMESDKAEGSKYVIETNPKRADAPWRNLPLPRQAVNVLQCVPALMEGAGSGLYILSAGGPKNTSISCTLQCDGVASSDILLGELKEPVSITSSANPLGFTDLLISTKAGIAYYSSFDRRAPFKTLLPEISFTKSVCYEVPTGTDDNRSSKIAIFGLSDEGDIYYIEGTREYNDESEAFITFLASGLPIRSNVKVFSGTFNPSSETVELAFVNITDTPGSEEIIYMKRDPISYIWGESKIVVPCSKVKPEFIKFPAFVTTMNLDNGLGQPLSSSIPVELSSVSPMGVLVGERRCILNKERQVVYTEADGSLKIIVPAENGSFACNDIHFRLGNVKYGDGYSYLAEQQDEYSITPAKRIIRMMGSVKTKRDIIDATTSDGKPVFDPPLVIDHKTLDHAAALMSLIPTLVKGELTQQDIFAITSSEPNFGISFDEILPADDTVKFFGDALQAVKTIVKSRLTAGFKFVKNTLQLVISIAGKIYRFAVNTTKAIVSGAIGLLESIGIDLSLLKKWWELAFCKVERAQKILHKTIKTGFKAVQMAMKANENSIMEKLNLAQKSAEEFIGRPREKQPPPIDRVSNEVSKILNNPMIKLLLDMNPFQWIMEAYQEGTEGLSDHIYIPNISIFDAFESLITKFATHGITGLIKFMWNIAQNIGIFLAKPESAVDLILDSMKEYIWLGFEMGKNVIQESLMFIRSLFGQIEKYLEDFWKLPPSTDMWYDFTGCKFSLLNFVTYTLAQIIQYQAPPGKDWFEGIEADDIGLADNIPDNILTAFGTRQSSRTTFVNQGAGSRIRMMPSLADTERNYFDEDNPRVWEKPRVTSNAAKVAVKICVIVDALARFISLGLQAYMGKIPENPKPKPTTTCRYMEALEIHDLSTKNTEKRRNLPFGLVFENPDVKAIKPDVKEIADSRELIYKQQDSARQSRDVQHAMTITAVLSGISFCCRTTKFVLIRTGYTFEDENQTDILYTTCNMATSVVVFLAQGILYALRLDDRIVLAGTNAIVNVGPVFSLWIASSFDTGKLHGSTYSDAMGSLFGGVAAILIPIDEPDCQTAAYICLGEYLCGTLATIVTTIGSVIDIFGATKAARLDLDVAFSATTQVCFAVI
ncbi:hypothetical protein TWF694_000215 [Orbilia ellipsospora]|uniref:Uncharacterized protein n=1 Tax=Orbilia ellipsospora TaxID=2528407 RepID=A0AAV9XNA5_9PEZI